METANGTPQGLCKGSQIHRICDTMYSIWNPDLGRDRNSVALSRQFPWFYAKNMEFLKQYVVTLMLESRAGVLLLQDVIQYI